MKKVLTSKLTLRLYLEESDIKKILTDAKLIPNDWSDCSLGIGLILDGRGILITASPDEELLDNTSGN